MENNNLQSEDPKYKLNNVAHRDLRKLMWNYYEIGLYTDCTIVAKCGRGMNLHKVILSASSELFAVS
jgi:hypothetical protein